MKDILTPTQMRAVDENTQYNHLPTIALMENAGAQIANYIIANYPDKKRVSIYAGVGGNGGDGFVVARHLLNHNYKVRLFFLSKPENIKNQDTYTNWQVIDVISKTDKNLKLFKITDSSQLKPDNSDIIVDAILGTGINSKLRQPVSAAVDVINYSPSIVISVDVPSGLNPEDGSMADKQVIPHTTLTLHKMKTGLDVADTSKTGSIEVLDIGIPKASQLYTGSGDLLKIEKSKRDSHKNDNGSILIVGSNPDYIGAVVFAANAALSQHIDLVYIIAPEKSAQIIKQYNPSFIVRSTPGDILTPDAFNLINELVDKVDAILLGSGAGVDMKTGELFTQIIKSTQKPVVLDADALKVVDVEDARCENITITPHVREFETFFDVKLPKDFDEKVEQVRKLSCEYDITILLKGVVDIIATNDDFKLNSTGNSGMTMGGTGDVLAGLMTALITKTPTPYDAAYIAAYLLGSAADKAKKEYGDNYQMDDIFKFLK